MKDKKWIYILILAFMQVACGGKEGLMRDFEDSARDETPGNGPTLVLKGGSYNVRLITNNDQGKLAWENRKQWAKKIVEENDFDILGTQEGYLSQIEDLSEGEIYDYVAIGRDDGESEGETCGILYKKDKFESLQEGTFWLSETPEIPSYGWDANIRRICTWVELKEKNSDKSFFVFNAHYDHMGAVAQVESSKLISAKMKEIAKDKPVIFTGDLNSEPTSDAINILLNESYVWDSKEISKTTPVGPEGTFYGYDLSKEPTTRIDYVFVSKDIDVMGYEVIDEDFKTGNIASDHLPVLVRLEL